MISQGAAVILFVAYCAETSWISFIFWLNIIHSISRMQGQAHFLFWDAQNPCIDGAFQLWITRNLIRIHKAFCRSLEEMWNKILETALGGEIWTFLYSSRVTLSSTFFMLVSEEASRISVDSRFQTQRDFFGTCTPRITVLGKY